MGSATSSAGGAGAGAAHQPEDDWVLEHVLFFNPQQQAVAGGALASYTGSTVKRFTPSRAKLRNRNFRVLFVIDGRDQEFLLKLVNHPSCRILLCDRAGRELKEILTSRIKYMERHDVTAEVYVRTDAGDVASLAFKFECPAEAELFEEYVKTLYGIQVHFFGAKTILNARAMGLRDRSQSSNLSNAGYESEDGATRQIAARREQKAQALQARTACPLHGNQACRCTIERPTLLFLKKSKYESDSSEEEHYEKEINARHAASFPVGIDGCCEAGKEIRLRDLAARTSGRPPAKVVEWFVALKHGKDPTFSSESESVGQAFRLEQRHVGKYVQVRASRRLDMADLNPFVYSLAVKGPVTVDDETARAMLIMLGKKEVPFEVTCKGQDLQRIFGLTTVALNSTQPFYDMTLTVTRQTIQLTTTLPSTEDPLSVEMAYSEFFMSLVPEEELDDREEDLRLRIHFPGYSARKNTYEAVVAEVFMPSEESRRHVFHLACFYRLQGKKGSFDRWARDLETGEYAFLKNKYARLWAETTWAAFSTIASMADYNNITTFANYTQQLFADHQQQAAGYNGAAGYNAMW